MTSTHKCCLHPYSWEIFRQIVNIINTQSSLVNQLKWTIFCSFWLVYQRIWGEPLGSMAGHEAPGISPMLRQVRVERTRRPGAVGCPGFPGVLQWLGTLKAREACYRLDSARHFAGLGLWLFGVLKMLFLYRLTITQLKKLYFIVFDYGFSWYYLLFSAW